MELLIIYSVIWFIPIWICYMICESKNRTKWKGCLAGFLLGWIGVLVCALLDKH